jgi:predicted esterase
MTWLTIKTAELAFRIDLEGVSPRNVLPGTTAHVLVIHAEEDPVVPFSEAKALEHVLSSDQNYEFWYPKSKVHGEGTLEFAEKVNSFFAEHFKQ